MIMTQIPYIVNITSKIDFVYRIITFVDVDLRAYKYSKLCESGIAALNVKLISSGYLDRSYAFFYA